MSTWKTSGHIGRHRRAEDLPVRRWLQLGAASAGMGAALVGWSLLGSEVGIAQADSGVASSSAAGPAAPANGVKSGSAASAPGRATTATSRDTSDTRGLSATSHAANRGAVAKDEPSGRSAAAETAPVTDRTAGATVLNTRDASRAARQDSAAPGSKTEARAAGTPSPGQRANQTATTGSAPTQNPPTAGTQFLGGGGVGPLPGVTAGTRDSFGAFGKLLGEILKSKTLANPFQRLDGKLPGLLDLLPKVRIPGGDALRKAEAQASEAEYKRKADAATRQIDDIVRTGVKLTARDGSAVYTTDGKTFVKYTRVFRDRPPEAKLVNLVRPRQFGESDAHYDRNTDIIIRNNLKLDPAVVRTEWGKYLRP
ncbi:hypothetical protein ACN27E_09065 [Mycobacterium sp. WMMD1722]|uniref:hypothetical protein n=1 Tax=Mycobacterium sp. WMMD1722 TaxID=3404117 RepID=UPI003BF5D1B8